ncbi:hypothetical protein BU23DRAFT_320251 [Bimuria novae-zelandiae CBS 107.79]|uniref:Uncharacterized protein n=1 Tax=Bimuria novae-zelandiae CBS 107.79 TaxID=1447943 RepID=A0A6A5VJD8_9PLEO|nr:hypothetical protein BU23DRAFT_320251 [Bimuria novae-zelandiae CBS 107.79]
MILPEFCQNTKNLTSISVTTTLSITLKVPRGGQKTKSHGATDHSTAIKASIITLRVVAGYKYDDIAVSTGVAKSSCSAIVRRAQEDAGSLDLIDLLDALEHSNTRSEDAAWWFPQETWHEAVRNHTPFKDVLKATIYRVCSQHPHPHPQRSQALSRVYKAYKPALSRSLRDLRVEYCEWVLGWLQKKALFVFTDETFISAGGRPHKRARITIERGLCTRARCVRTLASSAHSCNGNGNRPRKKLNTSSSLTWRASACINSQFVSKERPVKKVRSSTRCSQRSTII